MDRLLKRPGATRLVLLCVAGLATAAAWGWLAGAPPHHPHAPQATARAFVSAVILWQAMMVAMMTPAVAPWVGAYARLSGEGRGLRALAGSAVFAGGYFTVWLAFGVAAALLQLALPLAVTAGPEGPSARLAGAVLAAAGAYQFSPLKQACLTHCRNPLSYLVARWRNGPPSAFGLGVRHGAYCAGCCWLLMLTGLALGLMNLAWMAVLTLIIVLEQVAPGGVWVGRLAGILLLAWGTALAWPA